MLLYSDKIWPVCSQQLVWSDKAGMRKMRRMVNSVCWVAYSRYYSVWLSMVWGMRLYPAGKQIQTLSAELADPHKHHFFNCDINILWVRLLFDLLPRFDLNAQRWKRLTLSLCSLRKDFETKPRSFVDSTIPHHLVQGTFLCQHILSQCGFAAVTAHAGFPTELFFFSSESWLNIPDRYTATNLDENLVITMTVQIAITSFIISAVFYSYLIKDY